MYNGNILRAQWRSASTDNALKSYGYTYDALNRIIGARDNTGNYDLGGFDASGRLIHPVTYDKNGNILMLHRQGHNVATPVLGYDNDNDGQDDHFGAMDVLEYAYHDDQMSNRLYKVQDDGEDAYGFRDGSGDAQDYWYDANGNLISDANLPTMEYMALKQKPLLELGRVCSERGTCLPVRQPADMDPARG